QDTIMVTVPQYNEVPKTVTVMVPRQQVRTATRMVCRMVPTTETRTVCRDMGHYEDRTVTIPSVHCCGHHRRLIFRCGGCGSCGNCGGCGDACTPTKVVTCRVWVPNLVTEEQTVTVMRPQMQEETYQYTTTEYVPQQQTKMVRECTY